MNWTRRSLARQLLALVLMQSLAVTAFGVAQQRRPVKRRAVKITFDVPKPELEPGKIVKVKATVFDQNSDDMPGAAVKWEPQEGADNYVLLSTPLGGGSNVIMITGKTPKGSTAVSEDIVIHASSGNAEDDLKIHFKSTPKVEAKEITFDVDKNELLPGSKTTITATVKDKQGNAIPGAEVDWSIDKQFEQFAGRGAVKKGETTSTVDVFGLAGNGKTDDVPVVVVANSLGLSGVVRLTHKPAGRSEGGNAITIDKINLTLRSGEADSFGVTVKDSKGTVVDNPKVTAEVSNDKYKSFLEIGKLEDGKIKVTALSGNPATDAPAVILINIKVGGSVATLPIAYSRGALSTSWDVLPDAIVGDNFGRTIKSDYYCIEVAVRNDSGSDVSLAGMGFKLTNTVRPNTSYATVHGSLARRKLTHPRTLTLAAVDVLGSVMTGFNPFFHNLNHAKNFSQWIDIVSNPLAKGIDKVWKDSFVDEMSRLENDVLRDGKILTKGESFKTKIFFPKKALFADPHGKSIDQVRDALGKLVIIGYKFNLGNPSELQ